MNDSAYTPQQRDMAETVLAAARNAKLQIVTAESCTGGLIAGALTEIAGSSDVFDRGFVVYSYDAKIAQLGVRPETLIDTGAVSHETAAEMAEGAIGASKADIAVAVTGIAGPGGATPDKPVGLVYIATARRGGETVVSKNNFAGDRVAVRSATVSRALEMVLEETRR